MRIGVLGGTFDPIHLGHVQVADQVAEAIGLDQVLFVPAGQPWMKSQPRADAVDRLAMVKAAIGRDPRFTASGVDLDRPGPTYAVDTLSDLRHAFSVEHPGEQASWYFIAGADALADFMRWHQPERVLAMAHLIGVTRPGHRLDSPGVPQEHLTLLQVDSMDVSSTTIRAMVREGASIQGLVDPLVEDYIARHGLYRDSAP